MFVFRFKIKFEDDNHFSREVEFASDQTFEDFYNFMVENLKFDKTKPASFYLCNHYYRKQQEIVFAESQHEKSDSTENKEEEKEKNDEESEQKLVMKNHRFSDLIDDPHQRLLYVYDDVKQWTFYIELLKILSVSTNEGYPKIVKKNGGIPRELRAPADKKTTNEENDEVMEDHDSEEEQLPDDIQDLNIKFGDEDIKSDHDSADQEEPDNE